MTVFGALTTAVTGLGAQSRALGHISDNIANSQTVGYKRVDTSFQTLVTQSNSSMHSPGGVRAKPLYTNSTQGPVTQTQTTTNIAISGAGFFQVSRGEVVGGDVSFQSQSFFTRAGDFQLDRNGYLVNSAGYYLNGWGLRPGSSTVDRNLVQPIRVQQLIDNPTPTQNINLSANLPLTPENGATLPPTSVPIIDLNGETRSVNLNWRKQGDDLWRLSIDAPGSTAQPTAGNVPGTGQPQSFGTPVQLIPNTTPQRQNSLVRLAANGVTSGEDYSVTIQGKTFTYRAQSFDTTESVMGQILNQVNASGSFTAYEFFIADSAGDNSQVDLRVRGPDNGEQFSLTATSTAAGVLSAVTTPSTPPVRQVQQANFTAADLTAASSGPGTLSLTLASPAAPEDNNLPSVTVTVPVDDAVDTTETAIARLANAVNKVFADNPAYAGFELNINDPAGAADSAMVFEITGPSTGLEVSVSGSLAFTETVDGIVDADGVSAARRGAYQQVFVPLSGVVGDVGDVYTIPFGDTGETVSYTTDGTEPDLEAVATRLAALVNENSETPYVAEVSGAGLILTRKSYTNPTTANAGVGNPDTTDGRTPAHIEVRFGEGGVLQSLTAANVGEGNATVSPIQNSGADAFISFTVDFGNGPQQIRLNVGDFQNATNGLTHYAGTVFEEFSLNQDGFTRGAFRDLSILGSGEVVANYDNGRSRVLAQIPLIQVGNPEALQKVDGNAYVNTVESGNLRATSAGEGGAGNFVTSSIEGSNVDLADEFTKLIITQRAYSGNTRVVTASNEMLQEALSMGR